MFLDLSESLTPITVLPRVQGVYHTCRFKEDYFTFLSTTRIKAYRLVRMPVDKTAPDHWEEILLLQLLQA